MLSCRNECTDACKSRQMELESELKQICWEMQRRDEQLHQLERETQVVWVPNLAISFLLLFDKNCHMLLELFFTRGWSFSNVCVFVVIEEGLTKWELFRHVCTDLHKPSILSCPWQTLIYFIWENLGSIALFLKNLIWFDSASLLFKNANACSPCSLEKLLLKRRLFDEGI